MQEPARDTSADAGTGAHDQNPSLDRETIEDLEPYPDSALGAMGGRRQTIGCGTGTRCVENTNPTDGS
jgi:hypothetical protein